MMSFFYVIIRYRYAVRTDILRLFSACSFGCLHLVAEPDRL